MAADRNDGPAPASVRWPLAAKLAALLAIVALGIVALLVWQFGPSAHRAFQQRSEVLVERSIQAMREQSQGSTEASRELLVNLIRHTTDARQRILADLPLGLYRNDEEAVRAAIRDQDAARAAQLQRNVGLLAAEMTRRADARIEAVLARLGEDQRGLGASFAGEMQRSSLWLVGGVLLGLVVLLGAGLYGFVVRPVRELRRATQAVRRGDLEVTPPRGGADEVGALAADFGGMVEQLRASQRELQAWNQRLESEVERKTEHLQQAQKRLVQAEKMASLGTLAGGVAHEFNNIIGGIRGCAREALASEDDPERREPLEVMARAADRGASVTEQLLAFSRHRIGHKRAADLVELMGEVLGLMRADLERRRIEVVLDVPDPLPVWADPGAIHQVLMNLVRNAMQAMAEGGTLTLRGERRPSGSCLTVADTGPGIASEHLDRVFEPFFTTKDHERDPELRGSGLGLAVSYGVVEAHGGRLEVENGTECGAVFRVELPGPDGS